MNIRITLSAALAAITLFALAPAQAQAPGIATSQLEAKVQVLQSQVNALQAQVQQLQQQLRAASPSRATGPVYQMPKFTLPNVTLPNVTLPNVTLPNVTLPNVTLPNLTLPNAPGITVVPPARRYSNIPDCQITLLKQASR